jgi:putative heme iron utilization protein
MSHAAASRRLLRNARSGALATLSQRLHGHPFASFVTFMSGFDASPVLLVSRLAEHTKNIAFDARASLMVHEPGSDAEGATRLTVAGMCRRIEATAQLAERFVRLFPDAQALLELDFDFYRIEPTAIRYIGGFGRIHWVEPTSFLHDAGIDPDAERAWLARLNAGHGRDLARVCARSVHAQAEDIRAVALDCDGIDVRLSGEARAVRLPFPTSVAAADELPGAFTALFSREAT